MDGPVHVKNFEKFTKVQPVIVYIQDVQKISVKFKELFPRVTLFWLSLSHYSLSPLLRFVWLLF